MNQSIQLEQLKADILSDDWGLAKSASDKISEIGGQEVIDFLISLLKNVNASIRNVAALGLRNIEDNQALEPLLTAINKKENENNRGTLVYALQTLDCSHKLPELFDLLFYGNFEVQMGASTILDEQIFEFTKQDLKGIFERWQQLQERSSMSEKEKGFIQDYVDGFKVYLDK